MVADSTVCARTAALKKLQKSEKVSFDGKASHTKRCCIGDDDSALLIRGQGLVSRLPYRDVIYIGQWRPKVPIEDEARTENCRHHDHN